MTQKEDVLGRRIIAEQAEQPPTGEFTKEIRAELEAGAKFVSPQPMREAYRRLDALEDEKKRLNDLVFAYESVNAPVNPLLAENKAQAEHIERLKEENRELRAAASWTDEERHKTETENKALKAALKVAREYIGESSSDERGAQYDIGQTLKGE